MRAKTASFFRTFALTAAAVGIPAVVLGAATRHAPVRTAATRHAPVRTASTLPVFIPAIGKTVRYRFTRLAQGNTGPRTGVSHITLHRKSATSLTIQGVFDEPAVLTTLTVASDGLLQIPSKDDDATTAGTESLGDVVNGLNRLTGLFAGKKVAPRDGWTANVHLSDPGATAPVVVAIAVVNARADDFELHGVGQVDIAAKPSPNAGGLGFRGALQNRFRPGLGFGNPLPGGQSNEGFGALARPAVSVAVSIDARVRHGALGNISVVETRSVTVDAMPYVNVSGWTIEAEK